MRTRATLKLQVVFVKQARFLTSYPGPDASTKQIIICTQAEHEEIASSLRNLNYGSGIIQVFSVEWKFVGDQWKADFRRFRR